MDPNSLDRYDGKCVLSVVLHVNLPDFPTLTLNTSTIIFLNFFLFFLLILHIPVLYIVIHRRNAPYSP